ncbi:hypothetical protein AK830_g4858 [Neonectria ditissima]|uniref:Transcription factor domain-containing protein n=1 Tax=Neonectria ditissima TaxID=78410 RepID=A0A0P7BML1_9HYPO|nr:hypothetical protein AK830_g4858 [Neonectria ditissima]
MFAQHATHLGRSPSLTLDELKASLLLCIFDMSESVSWDTVTEVARITRMAELYHGLRLDGNHAERSQAETCWDKPITGGKQSKSSNSVDYEMEEWKSVWWCIYSLDTSCNAAASCSNAISDHFQSRMALPSVSISDFTNPALCVSESDDDNLHFIPSTGRKHWELMRMLFSKASCRNRNLYLGACSLMRSVTELRSLIRQGHGQDLKDRLHELESDCTAASFALPPWFFNPTRNLGIGETQQQHQNRLETLLVWFW